jgi:DUF971 family protein
VTSLPEDELHIRDVTLVGQYALQIGFESGHNTGLYTFRYLRSICECDECRGAAKQPA